jgi:multidrug efflux pump subunit AcrB
VLAIGIVVDDAIVIVEGVTHHIEQGLSPREAAEKKPSAAIAAKVPMSVTGTVVAGTSVARQSWRKIRM